MRTIVHLSDLHFGRVNPAILPPLLTFIRKVKPDLVAISGDLTQRARTEEFQAAREFLDAIPFPQIVVPGNHDVPLYNILSRFIRSLGRYRRYITDDLAPFFSDDEIAVAGVNTARALTFKDGRINAAQIAELKARFQNLPDAPTKIVVTHHPFDLPAGAEDGRVVGRARQAMEALAEFRVDLLLAGHFHIAHTGSTTTRFRISGYSALVVSSGTTTSTRGRGQANSFNVIRTDPSQIGIERWAWQPEHARFDRQSDEQFQRIPEGWSAATSHSSSPKTFR
jgi:3',5'-cyclic AMP phosphodiesterase CpdA